MGSKSKTNQIKSYQKNKTAVAKRLNNQKKENAQDIISKSTFNGCARVGQQNLKFLNN
jgi:hypothetical protein